MSDVLFEIPAWLDYANFDNYETEENPTTNFDFIKYATNQNKLLGAMVNSTLWQPKTNISVGMTIFSPNMPAGMEAEALSGGETAVTEPLWNNSTKIYQDSGVTWLLRYRNETKNSISYGGARERANKPTYGL